MYYPTQPGGIASLMGNPYGLPMTPMAPTPPQGQPFGAPMQAQTQPQGQMQGQPQPLPQQAYMQLPPMIPSPAVSGPNQNAPLGMYGGGMVRRMQQGGLAYLPLMYRRG